MLIIRRRTRSHTACEKEREIKRTVGKVKWIFLLIMKTTYGGTQKARAEKFIDV